MSVWILIGPPGVGKNTVAAALARARHRCAIVDVDIVRWMVVQPHHAPWDGLEGQEQQDLGLANACMLARNFATADYGVALLDVLSDATAERYRAQLQDFEPTIILLMASLEVIQRRNIERGMRLTADEITMLYAQQQNLTTSNVRIETNGLSVDQIVARLVNVF